MPENDEQDISARVQAPAETALEKFEREQLTRRQALKKFGMTSAMATFALFSVDDLARMVGKAMQQRAVDDKVVEQVAKEFQKAGIAMADLPSGPAPIGTGSSPACGGTGGACSGSCQGGASCKSLSRSGVCGCG